MISEWVDFDLLPIKKRIVAVDNTRVTISLDILLLQTWRFLLAIEALKKYCGVATLGGEAECYYIVMDRGWRQLCRSLFWLFHWVQEVAPPFIDSSRGAFTLETEHSTQWRRQSERLEARGRVLFEQTLLGSYLKVLADLVYLNVYFAVILCEDFKHFHYRYHFK